LIEHFAGKFPLWISPNQIKIITVTNKCDDFAKKIEKKFRAESFRVEADYRNESIGKKVREARNARFNYIITIGEKEVEKKNLAVKSRNGEMKFDVNVDDFLKELKVEVEKKEIN
ncbi:MAG: threonine--tRNA ligase, partial [Nanoarchaeota archaeon]|nr:threonine--tRNA ligase [Nanoarchaeota archaeon]